MFHVKHFGFNNHTTLILVFQNKFNIYSKTNSYLKKKDNILYSNNDKQK